MKNILFGFALLVIGFGYSQTEGYNQCGHYTPEEYKVQDSIDQLEFQSFYLDFMETYDPNQRSLYVIPVVVHIVHLGGSENISDEQVYSAITQLNENFNATNPELSNVSPTFTGIIGNPDIEFRLATIDPNGDCHKGITRTYSETTYDDGSGQIINAVEAEHGLWARNKYMSVFVCIDPNGNGGYTNYPSNGYSLNSMAGSIFVRHQQFGTMGTSAPSSGTTLAHEVGHWLNLRHVWGNSNTPGDSGNCSMDDLVTDTPNSIGWTGCFVDGVSCGEVNNVQNYMEYSGCRYMFTVGQAARMQATLNSSVGGRNNLWTTTNLNATGTNGPGELCQVEFSADNRIICEGNTIQFNDDSYSGVTSRVWTFEGGTPSSSTLENPIVTFNTAGAYNVSLEISDGSSFLSSTSNEYVVVLAEPGSESPPYYEGFETLSTFPDNQRFMVENEDGGNTWALYNGAGSSGSNCIKLENYGVNNGSSDAFISSTIDLSNVDPADDIVFNFKFSYKKRNAGNDEALRFYVSNDCGQSWVLRKVVNNDNLGTVVHTTPYTPVSGAIDWVQVNVTNINSAYYVSNFMYKIVFENDNGNNIFIDDINLYPLSMTNIVDNERSNGLSLFPNPTTDNVVIKLFGQEGESYSVELFSALGQKIETIYEGELNNGLNQFDYSVTNLPKGIYYVRVSGEGRLQTIKLIKE